MGSLDLVYPCGSTSPGLPQKLVRNNHLISSPDTFRLYSPNRTVTGLITGATHAVAGVIEDDVNIFKDIYVQGCMAMAHVRCF